MMNDEMVNNVSYFLKKPANIMSLIFTFPYWLLNLPKMIKPL